MWFTNTVAIQVKSLDGNQYSQVFPNRTYFVKIYPIAKKSDVGQSLKTFVMEPGVLEELNFNGSKYHNSSGTGYMNCCWRDYISLTKTDPERTNQNPEEGVIKEVQRQWF